jgi:glutathione reductase (NADPH)
MAEFDCDLLVIGAGSGGVRASRVAAGFGARVAIVERDRVGGTCVIRGCIPKKLLVYAAQFREDFGDAAGYGWTVGAPEFSWPQLIANKNTEIARLESVYVGMLENAGVAILRGTGRIVDAHAVDVGGRRITARYLLVAAGNHPSLPRIPGIEHAITSNEAFELPALPRRVLVVGGGYIGVEFAGIFNGLGAQVTLSYRGEQILRGFDDDVRDHLAAELAKHGIRVLLHSDVERIERRPDGVLVARFAAGAPVECDAVMYATRRIPNTRELGLAAAGVALGENGEVIVDRFSASSAPSVYAVGDVTDRVSLTPVAIREGHAVATTLFGGVRTPIDHTGVPTAVFSHPPVGTVGLTEGEAAERFAEVEIYAATFRPLKATLSGRDERTLVKLVVDAVSQRVVGAHMVGPDAPEVIQGVAIAVKAGLTKADFDATVGIHPTAAEEFVTLRDKRVVRGRAQARSHATT